MQFMFVLRTIAASKTMHQKMLHNVVRSPMSFFDTTPTGRIVNRFSDDISTIDGELPNTFFTFLDCLLTVIGALVVISFSTPVFMTVILPLGILYFLVQVCHEHLWFWLICIILVSLLFLFRCCCNKISEISFNLIYQTSLLISLNL